MESLTIKPPSKWNKMVTFREEWLCVQPPPQAAGGELIEPEKKEGGELVEPRKDSKKKKAKRATKIPLGKFKNIRK